MVWLWVENGGFDAWIGVAMTRAALGPEPWHHHERPHVPFEGVDRVVWKNKSVLTLGLKARHKRPGLGYAGEPRSAR